MPTSDIASTPAEQPSPNPPHDASSMIYYGVNTFASGNSKNAPATDTIVTQRAWWSKNNLASSDGEDAEEDSEEDDYMMVPSVNLD